MLYPKSFTTHNSVTELTQTSQQRTGVCACEMKQQHCERHTLNFQGYWPLISIIVVRPGGGGGVRESNPESFHEVQEILPGRPPSRPTPKGEIEGGSGPGQHPRGKFRGIRTKLPPPPEDYCCGRYASYWNAFLYYNKNAFH